MMAEKSIEERKLALDEERLAFEKEQARQAHLLEKLRIKWISGVVAVAITVITAISGVTVASIEYISSKNQIELEKNKSDSEHKLKQKEQQRMFLETFAERVMNGDLRYRRDFAFYVTTVATDSEIKNTWKEYQSAIEGEIEKAEADRKSLALEAKQLEIGRDAEEIAKLNREIARLTRELEGGADIRTGTLEVSQDYLNGYLDFMNGIGLKYFRPEEFLIAGASSLTPGSAAYGKNEPPPPALWPKIAEVAKVMDEFRERHGGPVTIVSAYRSPAYNAALGNAVRSQHLTGGAVDFRSSEGTPQEWAEILKEMREEGVFSGGIGALRTIVHVDVRGYNATWGGASASADEEQ